MPSPKNIQLAVLLLPLFAASQKRPLPATAKAGSPDLFGIFFEDASYSAGGGQYARLVQNRSLPSNKFQPKWPPISRALKAVVPRGGVSPSNIAHLQGGYLVHFPKVGGCFTAYAGV